MAIAKELLEILVCPKCQKSVKEAENGRGLICGSCALIYPIDENIPIMLIDEALPFKKEEE